MVTRPNVDFIRDVFGVGFFSVISSFFFLFFLVQGSGRWVGHMREGSNGGGGAQAVV